MTIFVSEFAAGAVTGAGPSRVYPALYGAPLAVTQVAGGGSSAAQSTISVNTATNLVHLLNNSTLVPGQAFFSIAASSTASAPTSTQVEYLPPNVPIIRGIKPSAKIFCWST